MCVCCVMLHCDSNGFGNGTTVMICSMWLFFVSAELMAYNFCVVCVCMDEMCCSNDDVLHDAVM
jgi:hypothetical protein